MSADSNLQDRLSKLLASAQSSDDVPTRPISSAQNNQIEKTATLMGTASELLEAKPADLVVPATPKTTSEQSGGKSKS